jgi:tRNA threonylcarbamoyladenosine biosynthesis protein TsaB
MLLAVDTSTRWMGIALFDGIQVVGESFWRTQNHHTVELSSGIENLLERCGLTGADLTVLAVATGPGSFTGLRIGMAVVKGLALALKLPVIGIPTLDPVAAFQLLDDRPLMVVLQAGRKRLAKVDYTRRDEQWIPVSDPIVITAVELSEQIEYPVIVCGELSESDREALESNHNISLISPVWSARRPSYLAELAWRRWIKKDVDDAAVLSPIYLHVAEVIPG